MNAPEQPLAGTKRPLQAWTKKELIDKSKLVFAARGNPFSLFGEELQYQAGIRYDIILGQIPGYALVVPPPVEPPPVELKEPEAQPYRRVSGVYFGDTVSAIIEMNDGSPPYIVYPGQRVGQTDWYVESIDAEKVVLVRYNNVDPKRVIVRLETPPFGLPGTGGGGGGGGNEPGTGGRGPAGGKLGGAGSGIRD
jgi:hypothetical protein